MTTSYQTEVGVLRRVLLKHPGDAWKSAEAIHGQWKALGYLGRPDLSRARAEFDALVDALESHWVKVELLPGNASTGLDSIYTRDASIVCDHGVILSRMGKKARRGEPTEQEAALRRLGVPILGAITDPGTVEGGDVAWLDRDTLAVGRGYRTNTEGIRQLREMLGAGVDVVEVALPHWRGPGDVFHLMSILSPIDHDLALVYSPLMPVPFREYLLERGTRLVEVAEEEFDSMGGNVLAIAPRLCIQLEGNPVTRKRLEEAGAQVVGVEGGEICAKGCGGPTCLTRPLERSA